MYVYPVENMEVKMTNRRNFQNFGVEVLGLDLSENMVNIAMERAIAEKMPSVRLNFPLT